MRMSRKDDYAPYNRRLSCTTHRGWGGDGGPDRSTFNVQLNLIRSVYTIMGGNVGGQCCRDTQRLCSGTVCLSVWTASQPVEESDHSDGMGSGGEKERSKVDMEWRVVVRYTWLCAREHCFWCKKGWRESTATTRIAQGNKFRAHSPAAHAV
jgi:hypothetical protein